MRKNFWRMLCALWTLAGLFYGVHCGGGGGGGGHRRAIGKDRRRGGGGGGGGGGVSDSFRPEGAPLDPLFTDQQEIRLSFKKERFWPAVDRQTTISRKLAKKKSNKKVTSPDVDREDTTSRRFKPRGGGGGGGGRGAEPKRPNIILMITDDQDIELGSLDYMPKVKSIMREGGAFFPNSYVSTPMCCPSRSSLLTGLFVHNHGVLTNNDNCSSPYWQAEHEPNTFGAYLAAAGYRTGFFGKYLNKYNGSYVPPGWREWAGLVMNSRYYNYTINRNGQKIKYGFDYHSDYYPDLITNDSLRFLQDSKDHYDQDPFLLVMSYPAPHGPEDSAPQYSKLFFNVTRHRTPSYDFAPNPDKQWILRWVDKMKPIHHRFTDLLMTKRLQTLQSVDDSVQRVFAQLQATGQLDNTYIFYTSDHGYHLGQYGLIKGKSFPFESDIRVPFFVRGPGISHGRIVQSMVGNVDLAPTFLDIAGVPIPAHMDGSSMLRFLKKEAKIRSRVPWRDTYLIERGKIPPPHRINKNQQHPAPPAAAAVAAAAAAPPALPPSSEGAEGDDSDAISVDYSNVGGKFERWAIECRKPRYQSPCTPFQTYQCVLDVGGDRWRMQKCRAGAISRPPPQLKRQWCKCKALSRYRLSRLDPSERRNQRAFLKQHTSVDWHDYRPRFLKTMAGKNKPVRSRWRRDARDADSGKESSVLRDVAEDELEQVELIMEDISDEISNLEALQTGETSGNVTLSDVSPVADVMTSTMPPPAVAPPAVLDCQLWDKNQVNCSSELHSDPEQWRQSRNYLEQQIRTLRVQLDEMKIIRKHLRTIRPLVAKTESFVFQGFGEESGLNDTSTSPTNQVTRHSSGGASGGASGGRRRKYPKPQRSHAILAYENRKIKPHPSSGLCPCKSNWSKTQLRLSERDMRQASRRRIKEARLSKKQKKLKRKLQMALSHDGQCSYEKMNCFSHDNDHWRTAPFWTDGPFCVCMNANNNTYWCIRTLNSTHNSLYCEFITGFVTYYDMRIDPYQLRNIAHTLSENELTFFHHTLQRMRVCKGADCFINTQPAPPSPTPPTSVFDVPVPRQLQDSFLHAEIVHKRSGKTLKRDRFWRRSQRRRPQTLPA